MHFFLSGGDGPTYFNTLYILDTETLKWERPIVTGTSPGSRRAHTTWLYKNNIYIYAGGDGVKALDDIYILTTEPNSMSWAKYTTTGKSPSPRGYHTSNIIGSKVIVFGGSDGHECFSDIHILDLETKQWSAIEVDRPISRLSHTATQVGSYLFIIGGHDGAKYSSEILLLNLVTMSWETRRVYGTPPSGRGYHTAVLHDSRIFLYGGYDGQDVFDDLWILDLSACAYLPQITDFEIGAGL